VNKAAAKEDRQCTYNVTEKGVRVTVVVVEKQYCEYVFVALGIQHAMHMRHIVIYGLTGTAICFPIFS
jgi:hypothetical protein